MATTDYGDFMIPATLSYQHQTRTRTHKKIFSFFFSSFSYNLQPASPVTVTQNTQQKLLISRQLLGACENRSVVESKRFLSWVGLCVGQRPPYSPIFKTISAQATKQLDASYRQIINGSSLSAQAIPNKLLCASHRSELDPHLMSATLPILHFCVQLVHWPPPARS